MPSIVTPIVNGFTGIPHQPNGHPAVETVYTNGLPPYSTQSPTAADTLQQAFTGVQQYTGVTRSSRIPRGFTASRKCCIFTGQLLQGVSRTMIAFHPLTFDLRHGGCLGISQPSFLALLLSAAIYPATTLTPIGQTLPQPPQVIQQQQQREGEGERTLLLLRFTHLSLCNGCIKKMRRRLILH